MLANLPNASAGAVRPCCDTYIIGTYKLYYACTERESRGGNEMRLAAERFVATTVYS